jgi:hypothetical protein
MRAAYTAGALVSAASYLCTVWGSVAVYSLIVLGRAARLHGRWCPHGRAFRVARAQHARLS